MNTPEQQDMIEYHKKLAAVQTMIANMSTENLQKCLDIDIHARIKRELHDRETLAHCKADT